MCITSTWVGINVTWPMTLPTIFVGKDQLDMWIEDPNNRGIENWKYTMLEDTLPDAIKKAAEIAGSDKVVLYDGTSAS